MHPEDPLASLIGRFESPPPYERATGTSWHFSFFRARDFFAGPSCFEVWTLWFGDELIERALAGYTFQVISETVSVGALGYIVAPCVAIGGIGEQSGSQDSALQLWDATGYQARFRTNPKWLILLFVLFFRCVSVSVSVSVNVGVGVGVSAGVSVSVSVSVSASASVSVGSPKYLTCQPSVGKCSTQGLCSGVTKSSQKLWCFLTLPCMACVVPGLGLNLYFLVVHFWGGEQD